MRRTIIIGTGIIIITALLLIWRTGYYPIARVGRTFLFMRDFSTRLDAYRYYRKHNNIEIADDIIQLGVISTLIDDILIRRALDRRGISERDIGEIMQYQFRDEHNQQQRAALAAAYHVSPQNFTSYIVLPQARSIALAALLGGNEKLRQWLAEEHANATVSFYGRAWKWKDGRIVVEP